MAVRVSSPASNQPPGDELWGALLGPAVRASEGVLEREGVPYPSKAELRESVARRDVEQRKLRTVARFEQHRVLRSVIGRAVRPLAQARERRRPGGVPRRGSSASTRSSKDPPPRPRRAHRLHEVVLAAGGAR
jgi:hypothetical protein